MNKKLITSLEKHFKETFSNEPLIFFSPGRINLIGEHTDYNEGYVFPAAVDKGIYLAIQKTEKSLSTAEALDKKEKIEFSLQSLKPTTAGSWINYIWGVISQLQNAGKKIGNVNLSFSGDIPEGAGMSSSAALENSIVFAFNHLFDLRLSKKEMILISQKAEHIFAGVKCGIMDQYASMFGKKDNALLLDCRTINARPYPVNFENYQLILINTNVKHSLSDSAYNDRRAVCESISKMLDIKALRDATIPQLDTIKNKITAQDYEKACYVIQENQRVLEAAKAIERNDLNALGSLLFASHSGLQHQYQVSCEELDFLVEKAKESDSVIGARMMGGGFGGCTLNLIQKEKITDFVKRVSIDYQEKFKNSCSVYQVELSDGTKLLNIT